MLNNCITTVKYIFGGEKSLNCWIWKLLKLTKLVCQGTIDEKILSLLKRKESLIKVLNEKPEEVFV